MSASGTAPGMLLVQMEPPPTMEEEFHAWYDTEHIPEREAVPGFLSAVRFVCVEGWPRYMACYDMTSLDVLGEEAYRSIGGENLSIWSKRVLSRVVGLERLELRLLEGPRDPAAAGNGKVMVRVSSAGDEQARRAADALGAGAKAAVVRLFENVLIAGEFAIMLDAPALDLVPRWSAGELASAMGDLCGSVLGVWRYRRYVRWR